jgi:hypothetical protein
LRALCLCLPAGEFFGKEGFTYTAVLSAETADAPDRHRRPEGQRLVRAQFIVKGDPFSNAAHGLPASA